MEKYPEIERIGFCLFGDRWVTVLAGYLGVTRQTIYSWKKRGIPQAKAWQLAMVMNDRIKEMTTIEKELREYATRREWK